MLMLKLVLTRPMAKNESTVTCLMVNEVHSVHPGLNGAASFPLYCTKCCSGSIFLR